MSQLGKNSPASSYPLKARKGDRVNFLTRSPLKLVHKRLGVMAGWARKAGHEGRAAAFADALRVIANIEKELSP
jgi:hypothetical protein